MKAVVLGFLAGSFSLLVGTPATPPVWHYTLLQDSAFMNDCPICGRVTIIEPMRGSFDLLLLSNAPAYRLGLLTNLQFVTRGDPPKTITGYGTIELESAKTNQQMTLFAQINGEAKVFTNDVPDLTNLWPMVSVHLVQTQYNLISFDSMQIVAAPLRELWFATGQDFTSTNSPRSFSAGDLLSMSGRVVKERAELLASVGIASPVPLDAVTAGPGGETFFSLETDASGTNGLVPHGDVLSNRRGTVFLNADLIADFDLQPPAGDRGLDALYVNDGGALYFSTTADFTSQRIGEISRGDVLLYDPYGDGMPNRLIKTRQQLLAGFSPLNPAFDPGLDALFVWSSGEIWFSTEQDFDSGTYGPIGNGDLLSDQGRIIFRESELLAAFGTGQTNRGLRSIFVVTDVYASTNFAPEIMRLEVAPGSSDVRFWWTSAGRVYQVQKAAAVSGLFTPASEMLADWSWTDPGVAALRSRSFYRLLAW